MHIVLYTEQTRMPETLVLSGPFSGLTGKISEPLALVFDEDEVDQQGVFSCGPQQDISGKMYLLYAVYSDYHNHC